MTQLLGPGGSVGEKIHEQPNLSLNPSWLRRQREVLKWIWEAVLYRHLLFWGGKPAHCCR